MYLYKYTRTAITKENVTLEFFVCLFSFLTDQGHRLRSRLETHVNGFVASGVLN